MSQNGGKKARYGVFINVINLYLIMLIKLGETHRAMIAYLLEIGRYEYEESGTGGTYQGG